MKSVFVTGSGQCGETFLNSLFKGNNKISARDESRPLLHSYYKFIKYNKINIDDAPLFNQLENVIKKSNKKGKIDFESSSFLALHIYELYKKFGSKFIILLRNPFDVSYSLKKKGWYKEKYIKKDKNKIIGYQGVASSCHNKHHNFCRLSPNGSYFFKWNKLDQMLKIKWYWDTLVISPRPLRGRGGFRWASRVNMGFWLNKHLRCAAIIFFGAFVPKKYECR